MLDTSGFGLFWHLSWHPRTWVRIIYEIVSQEWYAYVHIYSGKIQSVYVVVVRRRRPSSSSVVVVGGVCTLEFPRKYISYIISKVSHVSTLDLMDFDR